MSGISVCVLGGSGFIGKYIVSRLMKRGHTVKVLTRRRERHRELEVFSGVVIAECDVHDAAQLTEQLAGQDAVVNLVGILNEMGSQTFRRVHFELPKKVAVACQANGVKRLVHMSALNADPRGSSQYLQTKGRAEAFLHGGLSGELQVTSFRPSVIFGVEDRFMNRFAGLLRKIPYVFPLACAQARFAPVYVGDVADAIVDALDDESTIGQRINLCGPKQYTLQELVEYCASLIGVKRKVIPLPPKLARAQAIVMGLMPGKPFSMDNYRSLLTDSVCPKGTPACATMLEAIAPQYLGDEGRESKMQAYRSFYGKD